MEKQIQELFIAQCHEKLRTYTGRIVKCINMVTEEQVWQRPNEASNSIANLVLHLRGNVGQYILSSLGGQKDERQRDLEFSTKGGYNKEQLAGALNATMAEAGRIISEVSTEELLRTRIVQGFSYSGLAIVLQVTEHFAYHAGQIALLTKLFTSKDLGFYAGLDLNKKNQ